MHAPATINDGECVAKLASAIQSYFGDAYTVMDPNPGSEDFSVLARALCMVAVWWDGRAGMGPCCREGQSAGAAVQSF